jgi:thermostable 8-oxoguanine DNA glycosylase
MWELEAPDHYRLGMSLTEETLACMLGGYGIPAEVGLAAYARLRKQPANVLQDEERVLALLSEPLHVASRTVRYRFARQKAKRIAAAMRELPNIDEQLPDRALRDALTGLSGIGPKTASWIVRNWRGSDDVAILDIHILRLGRRLGIFDHSLRVERHYGSLEHQFLGFARALGARASMLDSVMWMTVRRMPARILANPTADRHPPRRASLKTGCSKGRQEALA